MSIKNKSSMKDKFKTGKIEFSGRWFSEPCKNPELFFNSSEFRKIKNRNKKKKGRKK